MAYRHLFTPLRIGALELRNRIAMAPMGVAIVDNDGTLSEPAIRYYEERARGGAGLLITEPCAISYPRGAQTAKQPAVSDDRYLPGLRRLTERVHSHGSAIAIQLVHHGKVARLDTREGRELWLPSAPRFRGARDMAADLTREEIGLLVAASKGKPVTHAATTGDLKLLTEDFADAAGRAQRAGFDAIELHAAHGYLLSEFLSPAWNHRQDDYGGSLENRARLLCEVIAAVKQRVGRGFPVWCRLDAIEYRTPGGITFADAQRHAELAVGAGADAIHVSAYADATSGVGFTEAPLVHREAGYAAFAAGIKERVAVPIIAVGRIEPEVGDAMIRDGAADVIAMGRKMLADPEIANKLRDDREADVRPCIYCYRCVAQPFFDRTVRCGVNPIMGREAELADIARNPSPAAKTVLIIGGGPAGLEAARVAGARGHAVTVVERSNRLGGRLAYAAALYEPNQRLLRWLTSQVGSSTAEVLLDTEATVDLVRRRRPDVVLVASGGTPPHLPIAGAERAHVIDGYDATALLGETGTPGDSVGPRVVIVGGGQVAIRISAWLARHGREITVLEPGNDLAPGMAHPLRWRVLDELRSAGTRLHRDSKVCEITADHVLYQPSATSHPDELVAVATDTVILVPNLHATASSLADALDSAGFDCRTLGDARDIGNIEGALDDGCDAALAL